MKENHFINFKALTRLLKGTVSQDFQPIFSLKTLYLSPLMNKLK